MIRETPRGGSDFSWAFTDGEIRSATQNAERRRRELFVSADTKRVSDSVSPLELIPASAHGSVAFKKVRRIPMGLREMTSGEGPEGAWTTCRRGSIEHRQASKESEDRKIVI